MKNVADYVSDSKTKWSRTTGSETKFSETIETGYGLHTRNTRGFKHGDKLKLIPRFRSNNIYTFIEYTDETEDHNCIIELDGLKMFGSTNDLVGVFNKETINNDPISAEITKAYSLLKSIYG